MTTTSKTRAISELQKSKIWLKTKQETMANHNRRRNDKRITIVSHGEGNKRILNQTNNICQFKFKQEKEQKRVPLNKHGIHSNNPNWKFYIGTKYSKTGTLLLSPVHSTTTEFLSQVTQIIWKDVLGWSLWFTFTEVVRLETPIPRPKHCY